MSEIFKKDDFLTATQAAKKLGLNKELVEKTMKIMRLKKATFEIDSGNGTPAPRTAIYNFNGNGHGKRNNDRLHPLAIDLLKETIEKNMNIKGGK